MIMQIEVEKAGSLLGHDGSVYTLLESIEDSKFISAGSDHLVVQWDLSGMKADTVLAKSAGVIYSICYFSEGKHLAVGNNTGQIHVIDLTQRKEIHCLQPSVQGVFDLKFDNKNKQLIAASADGVLSFWDASHFNCTKVLKLTDKKLRQIALNPDKTMASIACGNNEIVLIDLKSQSIIKRFEAHGMSVNSVQFSPKGDYLISGSKDAWLKVWEVDNDFRKVYEVAAHNFAIYAIVFSPDGKLFATASRDKTVKIWNASDFSFLLRIDKEKFDGHINSVNKIVWNEKFLISAGDDRKIMLWDIKQLL